MADLDLLHADPGSGPRSNILFSAIVATVAATTDRRLTVREIALRLDVGAVVAAQCIAFHRYVRKHADGAGASEALGAPLPADFSAPAPDDVIDEGALGLPPDLGDTHAGGAEPSRERNVAAPGAQGKS